MRNEILLREFMQKVCNQKDFDTITNYVTSAYTIYKDPSDPWEGRTLNLEEFAMRLDYTFDSFPDIHFEVQTAISNGDDVTITWMMTGTNSGVIRNPVLANKSIRANGSTKYHFYKGKIYGHTQVIARATVVKR
jgi:predicted ester cyclase